MSKSDAAPAIEQQVTFLGVRDLAATAAFYEDVLGLHLVLDQGNCRIYAVAGSAFLGFCRHLPPPGQVEHTAGTIVTLVSQDVDGWHHYLQDRRVPIEKEPTHNTTYHIYHLFVRDPDGYLIEIQRFLDPAWPKA